MKKPGKNAEKMLYALVGSEMRQYTGRDLERMTGLQSHEINLAVGELEEMGAVEAHHRTSGETYLFTTISLTAKGRAIFQVMAVPGCDT
ncbi:hypothetical protein RJ40_09220 [Methanofollis aquaemaris]|uniref:MarR family transcriptional regulator n=1 Tax=Methanofollis aquaemaris TaxID=126734 RepID=A0A8A3S6V8_9EURY|nr:hypothetical protein [Methanofollis aquaemaris]QSZ67673.1 hypothetical protein RJ40_09220 [Methanofollis aquaemaris]